MSKSWHDRYTAKRASDDPQGDVVTGGKMEGVPEEEQQAEVVTPPVTPPVPPQNADESAADGSTPKAKEKATEQQPTPSEWLSSFTEKYARKPLTPEEIERRKRAVYAQSNVAHLGNMFTALANLVGTAFGAKNQKLAQINTPDMNAWEGEEQKRANAYADYYIQNLDRIRKERFEEADEERKKAEDKRAAENHAARMAAEGRNAELHPYNVQTAQAQAAMSDNKAQMSQMDLDNYPKQIEYNNQLQRAQIAQAMAREQERKANTARYYAQVGKDGKIVERVMDENGNVWVANTRLSALTIAEISQKVDLKTQQAEGLGHTDSNGNWIPNYNQVAAYALRKGLISTDTLKKWGFTQVSAGLNWGAVTEGEGEY